MPPNKRLAPNHRENRWDEIKEIHAVFGSSDRRSFEFWFDYFWAEAVASPDLATGDKVRLAEAFFKCARKEDPTNAASKWVPTDELKKMSNEQKQTILRLFLVMGFKRIAIEGIVPPPARSFGTSTRVVMVDRVVDAQKIFTLNMTTQKGMVHLGFRGDTRTYEDLVESGGFKARSRSQNQAVHKIFGLDQPWHPFSLDVYAKSLFLRKGDNKDNCLHTVVSVAYQFYRILPYPLYSDPAAFPLAKTPFSSWTASDELTAKQKYNVNPVRIAQTIDHLEHDIRIFVVNTTGAKAFNTNQWQKSLNASPFPEAAVEEITSDEILAEVSVRRKYWFNRTILEFYDFDLLGTRLLPNARILGDYYGPTFPGQLENTIKMQVDGARIYQDFVSAKQSYEKAHRPAVTIAAVKRSNTCKCGQTFANAMEMIAHRGVCPGPPAK